MSSWIGSGLADWVVGDTAYISVVFSWRLPEAYQMAIWYKSQGYTVRAGGPALFVTTNKKYMAGVSEVGGDIEAITHHNPNATFASRGCPVGCYFCVVPKMEGKEFTFFPDFVPRPILCDNNLSALPVEYQNHVIRRYQETNTPLLDANSGFEPSYFDDGTYHRWKKINRGPWRFALDEMRELDAVRRTMEILKSEPGSSKRVYVLIGNEPVSACYERIMKVIEWGGEPHCQPIISLTTLEKKPMVRHDWTKEKLRDMARWANRWLWRSIKLSDYRPTQSNYRPFEGL